MLACTDEAVLPVSQVFDAVKELGNEGAEQLDPLIVTSASSLSNFPAPLIACFVFCLFNDVMVLHVKFGFKDNQLFKYDH